MPVRLELMCDDAVVLVLVIDGDARGVRINGRPPTGRAVARSGDEVRVGRVVFRVTTRPRAGAGALSARLDTAGGPTAVLSNGDGAPHAVIAEQRATLLYLLARQRQHDLDAGVPDALAGWCADDDIRMGIWGRSGRDRSASAWSVLVHRVRRDLADAGVDPACIEKRPHGIRITLRDLDLEDD